MALKARAVRAPRRPVIPDALKHRVPPGQVITPRWPVLHQGQVPQFDPATWDFRIWGSVDEPGAWTWERLQSLPTATVDGDLHCVSRWTTLDHMWSGVAPRTIVDLVGVSPSARFVLLHGEGGYTANLPIEIFVSERVLLATHHDGEPLSPEHGAPLRAVVPDRYAWKSVKWLRGVEFLAEDRLGFWEAFGYSSAADPWREERFES